MTFIKKTVVIDAKDHVAGRLAAAVAKELLSGQRVAVVRCEKLVVSGPLKRNQAIWEDFLKKRMNTNPGRGPFHHKAPSRVFFRKVRGMIPYKSSRGEAALKNLEVFDGVPAKYVKAPKAHIPKALKFGRLDASREQTVLGELAELCGWKYGAVVRDNEEKRAAIAKKHYHEVTCLANKYRNQAIKAAAANPEFKTITSKLAELGF